MTLAAPFAAAPVEPCMDTLDWDAQPDPFRNWIGAQTLALPRELPELHIAWSALPDARPAAALDVDSLSTLLRLSAGITAWKEYAGSRWALRAHPSSGNLHPTETYVIAAGVQGIPDGLHHYQSRSHALEQRAWNDSPLPQAGPRCPEGVEHPQGVRASVDTPLPLAGEGLGERASLWLGFSSIHWREAWKYGERAFRYCQLDLGHVLAAVSYAAALLGWHARLLRLDSHEVAHCLGLDRVADFVGVEAEEPEFIVALEADFSPPCDWTRWAGKPSLLDPRPLYQWPVIEDVAAATRGAIPPAEAQTAPLPNPLPQAGEGVKSRPAGEVILQRRSAQAFDGRSVLPHAVLRRLLSCLLPGGAPVWSLWPHAPRVQPLLLVHRVEGVAPGLYALPRSDTAAAALRECLRAEFTWDAADPELPLYRLLQATAAKTARTLSCHQDIASHGAVTFMLLAEFAAPIEANPAAYRHLHWEAGMLGHVITLEAEAAGWRGTGIGCYFDDADHDVLGLTDSRFQVLYHFAVGMPVDDPRLLTLAAYDE